MPSPQRPLLTCREVLDFIMSYLDGQLAPGQRHEFERHLAACTSCVNYVNSYKATVSLGRSAMNDLDEPAAATIPEWLIRSIREARLKGVARS